MHSETQELYDIAAWLKDKMDYHNRSKALSVRRRHFLYGEIWYCDLGYNIGAEKNKMRPVIVISNNKINCSEKVVVLCLTEARGKLNTNNLPLQDSWLLLYSNTTDWDKMARPGRTIPHNMTAYAFLDKDSIVQCEEIRSVSKARFDTRRGCIGHLTINDLNLLKIKFKRAYNL